MSKIIDFENWDLSAVPLAEQIATVVVSVVYPRVSETMLALTPKERQEFIAHKMQAEIDSVLAANKLSNWTLLKVGKQHHRYHGIRGEISVSAMQELAALAAVQSVQVEATNGSRKRPATPKKKQSFYCVKMTVAIQIEGQQKGRQRYEERYVLHKSYSEAEALQKAEVAASSYAEPYLNAEGLLVRWHVESIDDVYEVVLAADAKDMEGAEVFSVLKTRQLRADRVWRSGEE